MQRKVLIIDNTHPVLIDNLLKAGFMIEHKPEYTREDILREIENYDAVVVRSKIEIDKQIIDKAKRLRCIARVGAGMDAIDTDYAKDKGIMCLNSPEGNRDAVGEHAIGMLLCLFNKLNFADLEVRQGLWQREENRGIELNGKTIGIIGYGNMGNAFAKRLCGFDVNVIAYDKYKNQYSNEYAKEVDLNTIFKESDVLSLHIPLTKETKYMVDEDFIDRFSKPFYLINTARGKIVKTKAIVEALKTNKILGAALDVLEFEAFSSELNTKENIPQELKELFEMKNTILSPHVGGWSKESYYKLAYFLSEKIIKQMQ